MPSLFASPADQMAAFRDSIYSPSSPWGSTRGGYLNTGGIGTGTYGGSNLGEISYGAAEESIPQISDLINSINLNATKAAQNQRIPGGPALEAQSSSNIKDELAGKVPQDVINQLIQQGAERGVAMGSPGSPNASAAYLRALGLTSLDLQKQGQSNLSAALARNPAAPIYDPSHLVMTPYEAAQLQLEQERLNRSGGGGGFSPGRVGGGGYEGPSFAPPNTMTGTAPTLPMGPSLPFDWLNSINYNPNPLAPTGSTGTMGFVPPGSEYDPNLGLYYDASGNQFYSGDTAQPVEPWSMVQTSPQDYSMDQIYAGMLGQ